MNCGNGAAGPVIQNKKPFKKKKAPLKFIDQFLVPDGKFPNGIPNPLLLENQSMTQEKVLKEKADIGIAFDGDFDRCFFFDETGKFIQGEYIVGLLADLFLDNEPGRQLFMMGEKYLTLQILLI